MSGYAIAFAPCFVCKRPFGFNPRSVPSYDDQPICENCITVVNARRRELGNPEWPVPADAYEPIPEEEL